jgi:hypothetical protein
MDTFGKRISPQVIQEIRFSACRGRKLQPNRCIHRHPEKSIICY